MKKTAEKEMKTPPGGGKQNGADACLKPGCVLLYAQRGDTKACQGPLEAVVTNHHALMAKEADTKTPARNTSGSAPGRDLIILSVSNGFWHACTV